MASAISVGDIEINSALNQPLSAQIDINFSPGENLSEEDITVRVASPDQHHRNGLSYPTALSGADFSKHQGSDGVELHLSTHRPIQEPLLNFLLQIDWPAGRLLKEVPLFLDPPGYQVLPVSTGSQQVAASTSFPVKREILRPEPAQPFQITEAEAHTLTQAEVETFAEPEAAGSKPTPRRSSPITISDGQYGPVRPGDSLSKIARAAAGRNASSREVKDLMRAIYFVNPDAFLGSADELEAGSFLIIPDPSEVPSEALQTFDYSKLTIPVVAAAAPEAESVVPQAQEKPSSEPETVAKTDVAVDQPPSSQLNILPQDPAARDIARELSERIGEADAAAEREQDTTQASETGPLRVAAKESSDGSLVDALNREAEEALIADVQTLKVENAELKSHVTELGGQLADTQKEVKRLELRVDQLSSLQSRFGLDDQSLAAKVLRWAPWAALLLILPLLLFALFRGQKRQTDAVELEREFDHGDKLTPPRYSGDAVAGGTHFDEQSSLKDTETAEKLNDLSSTAASERAKPAQAKVPDISFDDGLLEEPDDVIDSADLKPSSSDTQETIRPPELGAAAEDSTQILQEPEDLAAQDTNLLQEAEVFLAYGQHAAAEQTINKLLAEDADNDRYQLLQLKLFSEAGRMNELQSLSVKLLQKYPNPGNGMHQQVQNICERAFSRHAAADVLKAPATVEEERPATTALGLADAQPDSEALDVTLEALTVDTLFKDDIADYLSDNTALALNNVDIDLDEEQAATTSATLEDSIDDLDLDQLTDEEMEALSQELDFRDDDGLDELALEAIDDEDNPNVEKFSDTDLRLPAIKIDPASPDLTGGLLDIELDLEAELEKADKKKPE